MHRAGANRGTFEKTPSIVKRVFAIALSFCIFKQLVSLMTFQYRVLSLSTPDQTGRYLELGMPLANEFANDSNANDIAQTQPIVKNESNLKFDTLRTDDELSAEELDSFGNVGTITDQDLFGKETQSSNTTQDYIRDDDGGIAFQNDPAFELLRQKSLAEGLKVQISNTKETKRRRKKIGHRDPYEDTIERAMFVISMGKKAAKTKTIERFVYSARKNGKYSGWIVVLTDAPKGRYDGMLNWTHSVIVMEPKEEDLKTHYEVPNMIYKRFKTMAIDYIDSDPRLNRVELIYYLDADIVFGANMNQAFDGIERQYGIGPLGAYTNATNATDLGAKGKMWMFKGNSEKWQIQGGQIIIDRKTSQPCLDRWRKGFDDEATANMGKDQYLLMEIKDEMDEARNAILNNTKTSNNTGLECEIATMEQKPYIEFPTVSVIRSKSRQLKRNPKKTFDHLPMVHVRNDGGTATMKDKNIRPYMQNLLRFRRGQRDRLGILQKVRMETTA